MYAEPLRPRVYIFGSRGHHKIEFERCFHCSTGACCIWKTCGLFLPSQRVNPGMVGLLQADNSSQERFRIDFVPNELKNMYECLIVVIFWHIKR